MVVVMKGDHKTFVVPLHQADAKLTETPPTSGTKYTVLAATGKVRIISIYAKVTWTVQPDPLEVHVTVDGQTLRFQKADPVSATNYYAVFAADSTQNWQVLQTTDEKARAFLLEGRSVKVEVETTGGTVSELACIVKYARW